jgi:LysM repeat protein
VQRQHGQTAYFIEGEGFVGEDRVGVRALPLTALEAISTAASPAEAERAFRFSRMFPDLPTFRPDQDALIALGKAMDETPSVADHPDLPAGFTYFGQFLDHDLTFDQTEGLPDGELSPEEIVLGRSPSLDLDSLYGRGPERETKRIYADDKIHLRIGKTSPAGPPNEAEGLVHTNDLPRGDNPARLVEATIGDPRNDENLAVAQTHLAFLKFHNAVVERLVAAGSSGANLFIEARRIVTQHYQWIVLHDFLPRIIEQDTLNDVLTNGRKFYHVEPDQPATMPIEFSVAAYRLGHSMIRDTYSWNRNFEPATLGLLFFFSGGSGDMGGDLPSNWIIDWRRFYDFKGVASVAEPPAHNNTRRIDTALAIDLGTLPGFPVDDKASLAVRNLLRGRLVGLPSGQAIAEQIGVRPLTPEQVRSGRHGNVLRAHGLDTQTPLWYYVLKEAEVLHQGERLGPVGSRLLAETFVGLIENSQISILSGQQRWKPSLPSRQTGHFTMVDLLLFVNDLNPLGPERGEEPPLEDTVYIVQPGDTLGIIASRFLGSATRWPEIFNSNRDTIRNPDRIRVGQALRIPLQMRTHVVQRGETLQKIAARLLGSSSRWRQIFNVNRDRIQNPDLLRVGQKLRIPSKQ